MNTMNSLYEVKTLCLTEDQFADLLIADDRGALSLASRRRHLEQCARCQAEFSRFEALMSGLRESAVLHAAAAQRSAAGLSVVSRSSSLRSHGTRNAIWSLAAAALAIVAALPFVHHEGGTGQAHPVVAASSAHAAGAEQAPAISDEALLDDINQDVSASVPSSLAPLANPSGTQTSDVLATRP